MDNKNRMTFDSVSISLRYARAERDLKGARPFGIGSKAFYEQAEIQPPTEEGKELLIAMTSDRGRHLNDLSHVYDDKVDIKCGPMLISCIFYF